MCDQLNTEMIAILDSRRRVKKKNENKVPSVSFSVYGEETKGEKINK